ncbi:MAG: AI-2E family transporter [Gammaproteobacteria bacterium]|nr:MAG: AI-2E family transporter [Gammaproteobacteria bacterium]
MSQQGTFSPASRVLITLAAFVIVITGIKQAESIISMVFLSAFFTILCTPPFVYLQRKGVPGWLSLILVIVGITLLQLVVVSVFVSSVADFKSQLPFYQQRLQGMTQGLFDWLQARGLPVSASVLTSYFNPGAVLKSVVNMLGGLGALLSNAFLIVLTVIFMLVEAASFPDKLHRAFEGRLDFGPLDGFIDRVKQYMSIKTLVSLATGLLVLIWNWGWGLDYAPLFGLLAFLLNFIPNIGSIIAAVPAVLLALVQLGPGHALVIAAGYLGVNIFMGNMIEPRYMGRGLGLSTLVVFLSLVFWGALLGPAGMLLSVPLTMMMKMALETSDDTRWLAVLLGPEHGPPATGPEDQNAVDS